MNGDVMGRDVSFIHTERCESVALKRHYATTARAFDRARIAGARARIHGVHARDLGGDGVDDGVEVEDVEAPAPLLGVPRCAGSRVRIDGGDVAGDVIRQPRVEIAFSELVRE